MSESKVVSSEPKVALPELKNKRKNKTKKQNQPKEINVETMTIGQLYTAMIARFDGVDTRIEKIDTRLTGLERTVGKITDRLRINDRVKEQYDVRHIIKLYEHNGVGFIKQLSIDQFYDNNGKTLSEFDGILLVYNVEPPYHFPLGYHEMIDYLVIESKHSLSKSKIDAKLKQMLQVKEQLAITTDDMVMNGHINYQFMIGDWTAETQLPLPELDRTIHLLFSSDDIPNEMIMYLDAIYKGISNEDEYDALMKEIFYSIFRRQLQIIQKDGTVSKEIRKRLEKEISTMNDLRSIFWNELKSHPQKGNMNEYLDEFKNISDVLLKMKGHVGYISIGITHYPPLFPKSTLNTNV